MVAAPEQAEEVIKRAREVVKTRPGDTQLHKLLAELLEQLGRYEEAVPHLAVMMSSTQMQEESLYARYAKALYRTGVFGQANQILIQGLARYPDSSVLLHNKAMTLFLMHEFDQARQVYGRIYELDSSDHQALGMSGYIKLLVSEMRDGFEEYSGRPKDKALAQFFESLPAWSGEPFAGKNVVLWSEQGIGDVIMFLSLLPWVMGQGPSVSVVVTGKLAPLVARSFPQVGVISEDGLQGIGESAFDFHLPLGDLLRHAMKHYLPAEHPRYLEADPEKTSQLRSRYTTYATERGRTRLIGLSWHTTNPDMGFTRNLDLSFLDTVFAVPGVQFISLQYGDHAAEIAAVNRRFRDILLNDPSVDAFNDLDALAAQMSAMDEIVTIDNSTVHLAGALGVPTTLLLSTVPDWRWGLTRADCRWYKSVRVERQETLLKWKAAVKRLRAALSQHV